MWSALAARWRNWLNSEHKLKKATVSIDYYLRRRKHWQAIETADTKTVFTEIYKHNLWNNEESLSGGGSTLVRTTTIRSQLPEIVKRLGISSILDAGCGDFHWMERIRKQLPVRYTGIDIVPDLIARNQREFSDETTTFIELDITKDQVPQADLVICRECLFHLSDAQVLEALNRFKASGAVYLLATYYPGQTENVDIRAGSCRPINLEVAPFCFPPPRERINEDCPGQCLGLWELGQISTTRRT